MGVFVFVGGYGGATEDGEAYRFQPVHQPVGWALLTLRKQVPPLRCAPVGMTILLCHRLLVPLTGAKANSHNKIVIPTGAQRSGGTCCFFPSP